jgi:hypothetical protein
MQRLVLNLCLIVSVIVSTFAPLAATAAAPDAKPLKLETSPLPINLSVDPGKTVSTDIRVKQNSGAPARLKVDLMKFGAYGDQGKPQLVDRQPGDDYFDWVVFDKPQFNAPDNVWQTVHMTIHVPKTAAFGYYYAVVFSRVGDDQRQTGSVNAIAGGTAVLVLLDVLSPNAKRALQLLSLKAEHTVYETLPTKFDVKFRNVGNIHAIPHGDIFVMKGNNQISILPINGEAGNILPNSNRVFRIAWNDGFPHAEPTMEGTAPKVDKKGNIVTHLVWSNGPQANGAMAPHIRFGKYTAHLFAVYDDGKRDVPMEATVSFWVIPWRALLIVILVLAIVGFGIFSAFRGAFRGARRFGRRGRR